ncbi:hypothetical protein HID58_002298 [Brassica napus]|uniref:Uncharacterized protein n=2 Tax=Brassica TaxID=3705 RepID=A0ABQ8ELV4_BRANA|nr:hypothetical protein HID58_002298 [Brassica napus]
MDRNCDDELNFTDLGCRLRLLRCENYLFSDSRLREGNRKSSLLAKCDRLKHNAFSEHTSMINTSIIVTDVPKEKAYHLKPRLLGKIAVVKCRYEFCHTPISETEVSKKVLVNDKLEAEKDDKLEGDAALNNFFHEIYLNSDEDLRSVFLLSWILQCFGILIDSFAILHNQQVESNGTVFSIDWKDVGAKKIESTLHDDLALKT